MKKQTLTIKGSLEKPILIDYTYNKENCSKGVVVFSHGFKGFKDWGPFNKIAAYFSQQGYVFVKFNFSHNGTTTENPIDFVDLKAFGNNNYSKELDDLGLVIDYMTTSKEFNKEFNSNEITLFGHSRGGAISLLKSAEDDRINNFVSWASPSNFIDRLPIEEKAAKWKQTNVAYIYNGRTKQNMPMYYQFYENCIANSYRLNIEKAVANLKVPHLHIHGDADPTVLIEEAHDMKSWNKNTILHIIKDANHVFDGCHPFNSDVFPKDLQEAIDVTIKFLKK
jgi:pimeloyl-ACP methyl ester carboxylesterase